MILTGALPMCAVPTRGPGSADRRSSLLLVSAAWFEDRCAVSLEGARCPFNMYPGPPKRHCGSEFLGSFVKPSAVVLRTHRRHYVPHFSGNKRKSPFSDASHTPRSQIKHVISLAICANMLMNEFGDLVRCRVCSNAKKSKPVRCNVEGIVCTITVSGSDACLKAKNRKHNGKELKTKVLTVRRPHAHRRKKPNKHVRIVAGVPQLPSQTQCPSHGRGRVRVRFAARLEFLRAHRGDASQ